MDTQRVFATAKKGLSKFVRELATLFMTLLFPTVLSLAFGAASGNIGGADEASYLMGVVEVDSGTYASWSSLLVGNLTESGFPELKYYSDIETKQNDLSKG